MILRGVPQILRKKLLKFLPFTLKVSEIYQVDPFWVLAIMWTESHFNVKAKSPVSAGGLMQIMPHTGKWLAGRLNWKISSWSENRRLIFNSKTNIEMGIFYLKDLLKMFRHNYLLATVAYNMGPGWVRMRRRRSLPVGKKNRYLDKVTLAYYQLSFHYKEEIKSIVSDYQKSYAVEARSPLKFEKKFMLFPFGIPVDYAKSNKTILPGNNGNDLSSIFL